MSGDPTKFTHVALTVQDLDQSLAFYESYTDLVCVHRRVGKDGLPVAWLGDRDLKDRFVIVLIQRPDAQTVLREINHFGFGVESRAAVERIAERARSEGRLKLEPHDGGETVGYFCMIESPDGNSIEFSYGQKLG